MNNKKMVLAQGLAFLPLVMFALCGAVVFFWLPPAFDPAERLIAGVIAGGAAVLPVMPLIREGTTAARVCHPSCG
ncbi:MAG: hypothetical protein V6Z81_07110 [Parvularculales bacterium]